MSLKDDMRLAAEEAEAEIEAKKLASLSADEKKLHEFVKKLLVFERDLNVPGVQKTQDYRVDRLLELISKESF